MLTKNTIITLIYQLIFFLAGIINILSLKEYKTELKGILFLLMIITIINGRKIKVNKKLIVVLLPFFLFNLYILLMSVLNIEYISGYIYVNSLAMFILLFGYFCNVKQVSKVIKFYHFGVLIMCSDIYMLFFESGINFRNTQYLVKEKNYLGPTIGISIVILFYQLLKNKVSKKEKVLLIVLLTLELYILFSIRSRANMVAVILCIAYLIKKKMGIKNIKKYLIPCLLLSGGILFFNIKKLINYLSWSLGFSHKVRGQSFFETFSSGRTEYYKNAFIKFIEHPFLRESYYYVDNLYLNIAANYGIVGLGLILLLFLTLFKVFKPFKRRNNEISIIFLYGAVASFLESMAPIGPGLSYFIVWFILGFNLNKKLYRRVK